MKSLAIIPARGGSKRLRRKNVRNLAGKPLVAYTLAAAQDSGCFDRILLSSDDNEILSIAELYAGVVAWIRPERLSGDCVTALELVCEITSELDIINEQYDVVALMLPTCPFRTARHLRGGFELLGDDIDGVVSLTTYEFPPQLSVSLEDGIIKPIFDPCPLITGNTRSQDQKTVYRPNGAFYIQWMKSFKESKNFWKGNVRGYVMDRLDSVDIDTERDLQYAQFLMENRK